MKSSLLFGQVNETGEHNDVIPLVLGFLKLSGDIAEAVSTNREDGDTQFDLSSNSNEQLVMATLGILSIRNVLLEWLEQACPEDTNTVPDQPAPQPVQHVNLMR